MQRLPLPSCEAEDDRLPLSNGVRSLRSQGEDFRHSGLTVQREVLPSQMIQAAATVDILNPAAGSLRAPLGHARSSGALGAGPARLPGRPGHRAGPLVQQQRRAEQQCPAGARVFAAAARRRRRLRARGAPPRASCDCSSLRPAFALLPSRWCWSPWMARTRASSSSPSAAPRRATPSAASSCGCDALPARVGCAVSMLRTPQMHDSKRCCGAGGHSRRWFAQCRSCLLVFRRIERQSLPLLPATGASGVPGDGGAGAHDTLRWASGVLQGPVCSTLQQCASRGAGLQVISSMLVHWRTCAACPPACSGGALHSARRFLRGSRPEGGACLTQPRKMGCESVGLPVGSCSLAPPYTVDAGAGGHERGGDGHFRAGAAGRLPAAGCPAHAHRGLRGRVRGWG